MINRRRIFVFMIFLFFLCINISTSNADDKKGQKGIIDGIEANMVLIPAGEFLMGGQNAANESPRHKVYLDAFYIGKYEVTFEEYEEFCSEVGYNRPVDPRYGYQPPEGMAEGRMPVMNVERDDAEAYCEWLSKKTGKHYRLPTEAEWEKAARGNLEGKEYPWGNEAPDAGDIYRTNYGPGFNRFAWKKDGYEHTAPVGSYPPNGYGIYDMAGNVWEWVQDWYSSDYYSKSPYKNPKGPAKGLSGIIRGGCFSSKSEHLRCAKRHAISTGNCSFLIGFRIAQDP
jgi:formylglycine-generating enzyme required for sulfatase activity